MDQSPDVWHIGNVTETRIVKIETRDCPTGFTLPRAETRASAKNPLASTSFCNN